MSIWTTIPGPIAYTPLLTVDDDRATLPAYNNSTDLSSEFLAHEYDNAYHKGLT